MAASSQRGVFVLRFWDKNLRRFFFMKKLLALIVILAFTINLGQINTFAATSYSSTVGKYIMSWQLDNGGWTKDKPEIFTRYWDGSENKAKYYQQDKVTPLGTIDNDATVEQIEYLAGVYANTGDSSVKASILEGFDFLTTMQYPSGGFPQVYPKQDAGSSVYENDATFNDDATLNVMQLLKKVVDKEGFYNSSLISSSRYAELKDAYERGLDFILKSQIEVNGVKTVWGGQHDPVSYETTKGRSFEPVSQIAQESARLVAFLEDLNSSDPAVKEAVVSAKIWFHDVVEKNTKYYQKGYNGEYFVYSSGSEMWYRFYEIGTNTPVFGDRDGLTYYDIMDISQERRDGYGWAGTWGKYIYADSNVSDLSVELLALQGSQEEPVVEEPVVEEPTSEPIVGGYTVNGDSYIDDAGFHFVESGTDSIITPLLTSVEKGSRVELAISIADTNRTTSELIMSNSGLRSGKSDWILGHGIKTKTLGFDVTADLADNDKYIEFEIAGGQNGESIHVSKIVVTVDGVVQTFEEPVVEEPVVEEPVVEEPVVEEPVVVGYTVEGNSYIDDAGFHFVESGTDSITTPVIIDAVAGSRVELEITIAATDRTTSELIMSNTGLRSGKSDWVLGHGIKTKTLGFDVTKDLAEADRTIEFEIAGGNIGESIHVSSIKVFVDGVEQTFETSDDTAAEEEAARIAAEEEAAE